MGASANDKKRSWTATKAVEVAAGKLTNDDLFTFYKALALANGYTGAGHMYDYKHFCFKNSLV